jgi:hypothetical protein
MSKVKTLGLVIPKLNYFDIQAALHVVYDPKKEYFRIGHKPTENYKKTKKINYENEEEFLDHMSLQHAKKN